MCGTVVRGSMFPMEGAVGMRKEARVSLPFLGRESNSEDGVLDCRGGREGHYDTC
jgi:hypothetical protein